MEVMKFTGWVEKIYDADQYKREVAIANYFGEEGKEKMLAEYKDRKSTDYPTALKFQAGIKSGAADQLDGLVEGDKVRVQYCLSGKSGVSKKTGNYYCINELNICKKDGVVVVERAKRDDTPQQAQIVQEDFSDIPF